MSATMHHNAIVAILAIIGTAVVASYLLWVYLDARATGPDFDYEAMAAGMREGIDITPDLGNGTWSASYDGRVTTCHESAGCALECARASRARMAA